ncbi:thiol reductant ABC exporter subunit CydC [Schaalia sp. ZJ405]|uniref:thiol reductant ABC exporter subunit CydC n=1 Tax=Schaalia sp. ZJ405 TaxID=2709403 RepID=UPI0013EBAFAB|nr:thiol reductant ABC exporter subunit CydC [Schaalia sp. ZJ405]QPK81901.1 thiol reductant ABC exporter subunit CydC [Schaalia sp. ZJ405]
MTLFLTKSEKKALRRIIPLLGISRRALALSILLGTLGLGSAIALGSTAAWLIARASQHPPVLYLLVAATAVRLFGVSRSVLRYCQRLASHKVALTGMDALRQNVYDIVSRQGTDRIMMLRRGDLLARTGADVDDVGDIIVKSLMPTAVAFIVGIATVTGFAFISLPAALILALCLCVSGIVAPLLSMRAARLAEYASRQARTDLSTTTLTLLEGTTELQVNGTLPRMHSRLSSIEDALTSATARSARVAGIAAGVDRLAMGLAVVASLLIGIPETTSGVLAEVLLAVLVLTPLSSFEGTAEVAPACAQLVRSAGAAERIAAMLFEDEASPAPASHAGESTPTLSTPTIPAQTDPTTGALTCILRAHNLAIGWPGGPIIASGIDLTLTPGTTLAIVGPSGIGKTTLLMTLAGLIPPRAGSVTINGVNAWEASRADITQFVTVTAEDAHVFATSVLENIRVARPNLDEDEATQLLERVGLGSWLTSLPQGLTTTIGSQARTVSGGERRRLLMARALAVPAPLMLVDEAGEHLDGPTADALVRTLVDVDHSRGVLVVSHRLSALDAADEVLLIDAERDHDAADGPARIIARGTHAHLMETNTNYRWSYEQEHAALSLPDIHRD